MSSEQMTWPEPPPLEPTCPVVTRDDVKWTLGNWLLGENRTDEEIRLALRAANEMERCRELCLRMKMKVDEGLAICFFPARLRQDIRHLLDEMDTIDHGVQSEIERRNKPLDRSISEPPKSGSYENTIVAETYKEALEKNQELSQDQPPWAL